MTKLTAPGSMQQVCVNVYILIIFTAFSLNNGGPHSASYELHDITVTMITLWTTHQKL